MLVVMLNFHFKLYLLTDMIFICSSGLIFMFVKTDVQLHPNSESIPLLIDEVSILTVLMLKVEANSPCFSQG